MFALSMSHRKPAFKISYAIPYGVEHSPVATMLNAAPRLFCDAWGYATDETARGRARFFRGTRHKLREDACPCECEKGARLCFAAYSSIVHVVRHSTQSQWRSPSSESIPKKKLSGQNLCLAVLLVPIEHSHSTCSVALPSRSVAQHHVCRAAHNATPTPLCRFCASHGDEIEARSSTALQPAQSWRAFSLGLRSGKRLFNRRRRPARLHGGNIFLEVDVAAALREELDVGIRYGNRRPEP